MSVRQILYSSSSGASGEMIQGVEQPYEISVVNGLDQFEELDLILSTYPNPVTDLLILKVEGLKRNDLNFQLYNSDGRITETSIDMSHLAPGVYFLQVTKEKDAQNDLITNQAVAVQISIIQGTPSNTPVYTEVHSVNTNDNGLVSVEIGTSSPGEALTINNGALNTYVSFQNNSTGTGASNGFIVGIPPV